jgi:hypothetical protein
MLYSVSSAVGSLYTNMQLLHLVDSSSIVYSVSSVVGSVYTSMQLLHLVYGSSIVCCVSMRKALRSAVGQDAQCTLKQSEVLCCSNSITCSEAQQHAAIRVHVDE